MNIPYDAPTSLGSRFIDIGEVAITIIRVIVRGWQLAQEHPEVAVGNLEVPITERLRDGMRQALAQDEPSVAKRLIVLPGTESRSSPSTIVPDGRTDIPLIFTPIFESHAIHDPHAIVECKRLICGDRGLAREYVREGIDRFRLGKYGSNHARGFMAAYVSGGDPAMAANGVNGVLIDEGRSAEQLTPTAGDHWLSQHDRAVGEVIELFHALLEQPLPRA